MLRFSIVERHVQVLVKAFLRQVMYSSTAVSPKPRFSEQRILGDVKHISHIRCISAYRRLELCGALDALSPKERNSSKYRRSLW